MNSLTLLQEGKILFLVSYHGLTRLGNCFLFHSRTGGTLLHGSKIAIFWVFFKSTAMSCRGLTHYCTNVEKRLCHAVT
ncbi:MULTISPECIES: hypothetical protein [unclassified Rickettsia]|uniref:hypothetical protein n=1 Tax=unclassified Rickettsia TaxID=114295 RepID=UPI0031334549